MPENKTNNLGLDAQRLLLDAQKETRKSSKKKDKIIILLIILLFLEPVAFFVGFLCYESQFEYVDTYESSEETTVDLDSSGNNANAEYNEVAGDQYNDNSTHNEGGVE